MSHEREQVAGVLRCAVVRINIHIPDHFGEVIDRVRGLHSRSRWIANLIAERLGETNTTPTPGRPRRDSEENPYERIQPMLDRMAQVCTLDESYSIAWSKRDHALCEAAQALGYELPTERMYEGALREHFAEWPQYHAAE